jgi:ketosteroid isomerase-like protein
MIKIGILLTITYVILIFSNIGYCQENKAIKAQATEATEETKQVKEVKQYTIEELKQQVIETERAFAETMAKRDYKGFASFLSNEAVFIGSKEISHGKEKVLQYWKPFYEKAEAPFSWKPDKVEVLESGSLAISTGPVYDSKGKLVATFTSVWRLEAPQTWRIIFDKGDAVCPETK